MENNIVLLVTLLVTVIADQEDFPRAWDCDDIKCVDMEYVGAPCYIRCPRGHTCRIPETGEIIEAGIIRDIGTMSCTCRDKSMPNWDVARCTRNTAKFVPRQNRPVRKTGIRVFV